MNRIKVVLNYGNLASNYLKIRDRTGQGQYCIPVIKSDGYGFGSFEVVKTLLNLQKPQKKYFVFALAEAVDLRKYFGDKIDDIYVLNGINSPFEAKLFVKYKITPVIASLEHLSIWKKQADLCGKILNAVIKFNTGMNRSGNSTNKNDILALKNKIDGKLNVEMIMSHFACAEDSEHSVTKQQIKNFEIIVENFPEAKRCFCASDAIFTLPQYKFEATRPGYFLYGLNGEILFPEFNFKQVLEKITARVLKENNEYYINIGLEDGLLSSFKNKAHVLVEGKEIPYKEIKKDRIVLDSNENIENKIALVNGFDETYNKSVFMFDFFNTVSQEFCVRLLPSLKNKQEKFELQIVGDNFDDINEYKKYINNSFLNNSTTIFKNGKLHYLETTVLEIIEIKEDGCIGYGATREVKKGEYFANIFNGYSDIFPRGLSNRGCHVFIEAKNKLIKCEIYGRISMDQISVKIPAGEEKNITQNCKVLLFDEKNNIDCITEFVEKSGLNRDEMEYTLKMNKRTNFIEI